QPPAPRAAMGFTFVDWSKDAFDRAAREGKLILIDGEAAWCHWCHVMDETTYRDPEVGRLLATNFVAIRVDIDARPDIAERYGDWGWPATILLSPTAEELGKFKGYLPPEKLREILTDVVAARGHGAAPPATRRPPPVAAALPWIGARAAR